VWSRERPTSALFYLGSTLVVLAVLGVTLFPLAPNWARCGPAWPGRGSWPVAAAGHHQTCSAWAPRCLPTSNRLLPPVLAPCAIPLLRRLAVLYVLTALLLILLGTTLLRYVAWGSVWILTGSHFWLLPNMFSETVRRGPRRRGGCGCLCFKCQRACSTPFATGQSAPHARPPARAVSC
jgi:hypothetical protein